MRIDPNLTVSQIAPISREGKSATRTAESKDGSASVVSLSSAAGTAATEKPSQGITARLAAIKSAVDAGSYPIDLDKLASRIVDDDLVRGTKQ